MGSYRANQTRRRYAGYNSLAPPRSSYGTNNTGSGDAGYADVGVITLAIFYARERNNCKAREAEQHGVIDVANRFGDVTDLASTHNPRQGYVSLSVYGYRTNRTRCRYTSNVVRRTGSYRANRTRGGYAGREDTHLHRCKYGADCTGRRHTSYGGVGPTCNCRSAEGTRSRDASNGNNGRKGRHDRADKAGRRNTRKGGVGFALSLFGAKSTCTRYTCNGGISFSVYVYRTNRTRSGYTGSGSVCPSLDSYSAKGTRSGYACQGSVGSARGGYGADCTCSGYTSYADISIIPLRCFDPRERHRRKRREAQYHRVIDVTDSFTDVTDLSGTDDPCGCGVGSSIYSYGTDRTRSRNAGDVIGRTGSYCTNCAGRRNTRKGGVGFALSLFGAKGTCGGNTGYCSVGVYGGNYRADCASGRHTYWGGVSSTRGGYGADCTSGENACRGGVGSARGGYGADCTGSRDTGYAYVGVIAWWSFDTGERHRRKWREAEHHRIIDVAHRFGDVTDLPSGGNTSYSGIRLSVYSCGTDGAGRRYPSGVIGRTGSYRADYASRRHTYWGGVSSTRGGYGANGTCGGNARNDSADTYGDSYRADSASRGYAGEGSVSST